MVDERELDEALDRGAMPELPPNVPPGMLGEHGLNVAKVDTFRPTLSSGISQDSTVATRQLTILVLFLFVFTAPLAAWLLWRDPTRRLRAKVIGTIAALVLYFAIYLAATGQIPTAG